MRRNEFTPSGLVPLLRDVYRNEDDHLSISPAQGSSQYDLQALTTKMMTQKWQTIIEDSSEFTPTNEFNSTMEVQFLDAEKESCILRAQFLN